MLRVTLIAAVGVTLASCDSNPEPAPPPAATAPPPSAATVGATDAFDYMSHANWGAWTGAAVSASPDGIAVTFTGAENRAFVENKGREVKVGETLSLYGELIAQTGGQVVFQIVRSCDPDFRRLIEYPMPLNPGPNLLSFNYTFEENHPCIRVQMRPADDTPIDLIVSELRVTF